MQGEKNFGKLFCDFYCDLYANKVPNSASQDLKYYISCRQNRLKRLNIEEKYKLKIEEQNGIYRSNNIFSDILGTSKFNTAKYWRIINYTRNYKSGEKIIDKKKCRAYLYETIYDVSNKEDISKEIYNCPNCGAPAQIGELENTGCKYCGTKFEMDDLFPKISNYYTTQCADTSMKDRKRFIKICGLICSIILTIVFYLSKNIEITNSVLKLVSSIFVFGITFFLGCIAGSILWLFSVLIKTIVSAESNSDIISISKSSKEQINKKIEQIIPNLKYEYFESKVVSLVKSILINDTRDQLPQNNVEKIDKSFDYLVDMMYRSVIKLKDIRIDENRVVAEIYAYFNNDYYADGKIINVNECILVTMHHDVNSRINTQFMLSAVNCKGCGASFDATHQKKCPHCGREYSLEKDDWVVDNIQKV